MVGKEYIASVHRDRLDRHVDLCTTPLHDQYHPALAINGLDEATNHQLRYPTFATIDTIGLLTCDFTISNDFGTRESDTCCDSYLSNGKQVIFSIFRQ